MLGHLAHDPAAEIGTPPPARVRWWSRPMGAHADSGARRRGTGRASTSTRRPSSASSGSSPIWRWSR